MADRIGPTEILFAVFIMPFGKWFFECPVSAHQPFRRNMQQKQNPPHKHHFVPQFWIKNWAGADDQVQRFRNPYRQVIASERKYPAAVGWHDKLYEIPTHGKKLLDFETLFFKKVDQAAFDLFEKLKTQSAPSLGPIETEALAVFLITLLHRSPAGMLAMRKLSRHMEREIREELRPRYSELKKRGDPPTVEEYEALQDPDSYLDYLAGVFRTVVMSDKIANMLVQLSWRRVLIPDNMRNLLLGDDPLIRTNGIAQPEGHVAFPLTPKIAIFGTFCSNHFDELMDQPLKNIVRQMNTQAVETARHFVVDRDERQLSFVSNRFGKSPRPTLSEASLKEYELSGH